MRMAFVSVSTHVFVGVIALLSCMGIVVAKHGSKGSTENCDLVNLEIDTVVSPADTLLYDESRAQWASDLGSKALSDSVLAPAAIVYCQNENDVLTVIEFASQCGYVLSTRSGGHQYSGFSSCRVGTSCIQVDVSNLESFAHDPSTDIVTLGVGLVVEQVVESLFPLNLVIPMGICNTVGVGGHFQTSSLGFPVRSFGLGMDSVVSFRIATANAEVLEVSRDHHNDLYKAVLGGGPGSFGIVLDFTLQTFNAVDYPNSALVLLVFPYARSLYDAVMSTFMELSALPEHARDWTPLVDIGRATEAGPRNGDYTHTIEVYIAWYGVDSGSLYESDHYAKIVQPFLDLGAVVAVDTPMPINVMMNQLRFDFDHTPFRYLVDNVVSDEMHSTAILAQMGDEIDTYIAMPNVYVSFQFQVWGGTGEGSQFNRNVGINGFPHREIRVLNDNWVFFLEDELAEEVEQLMTEFRLQRAGLFGGISKVQYGWATTDTLTADKSSLEADWPDYYPSKTTFRRLQEVKKMYDPDELFKTDMTIPIAKKKKKKGMGKGKKKKRGGKKGGD